MFEISIKPAAQLTEEEKVQVDEVSILAYSAPDTVPEEGDQDIEWSDPDWWILGRLEKKIVSLVGIVYREVQVVDRMLPVGGFGGVATHPDYQRQGLASHLMKQSEIFMREELKVPFGLLVCNDCRVPYYSHLGWHLLNQPMVFDWQGKKRVLHENGMVLPFNDQAWPEGPVDLRGKPW